MLRVFTLSLSLTISLPALASQTPECEQLFKQRFYSGTINCISQAQTAPRLKNYLLARSYEALQQYEQAMEYSSKLSEEFPDNLQFTQLRANLALKSGDYSEAAATFNRLAESDEHPRFRETMHIMAVYSRALDPASARTDHMGLSELELLRTRYANNPVLLQKLAEIYARNGLHDRALSTYQQLSKEHRYSQSGRLQLASYQFHHNDPLSAQLHFMDIALALPDSPEGLSAIGHLLAMGYTAVAEQNIDQAKDLYQTMNEAAPWNRDVRLFGYFTYMASNQLAKATEIAGILKQVYPDRDDIAQLYVITLIKSEKYDEALGEIDSLSEYGTVPSQRINGLRQQTLARYVAYLRKNNDTDALVNALIYASEHKLHSFVHQNIAELVTAGYISPAMHYLMARYHEQTGNITAALPRYQKALSYIKSKPFYLLQYQLFLEKLGSWQQAAALLPSIRTLFPDYPPDMADRLEKLAAFEAQSTEDLQLATTNMLEYQKLDQYNVSLTRLLLRNYTLLADSDSINKQKAILKKVADTKKRYAMLTRRAGGLVGQKSYSQADKLLNRVLAAFPFDYMALYWKGASLAAQNKPQEALAFLNRAALLVPSNRTVKHELARVYVLAGQHNKASELYETLANEETLKTSRRYQHKLAVITRAKHLESIDQQQQAVQSLELLTPLYPRDFELVTELLRLYQKLEMHDTAYATIQQFRDQNLHIPQAHMIAAELRQAVTGKSSKISDFEFLLRHDSNADIQTRLIEKLYQYAEQQKKRVDPKLLRQIIHLSAIQPDNISRAVPAIALLDYSGKKNSAIDRIYALLYQAPDSVFARNELSRLLTRHKLTDAAIGNYTALTHISDDISIIHEAGVNLSILYNVKAKELVRQLPDELQHEQAVEIAKSWIERSQYDAAFHLLQAVLEQDDNQANAHYWIGAIYDRRREFELAMEHTLRSIYLTPNNYQLLSAYARILARSDRTDAAKSVYDNIIFRTNSEALKNEARKLKFFVDGQVLMARGKLEDAKWLYLNMLQEWPDDNTIRARLGTVYTYQNELKRARKIFEDIAQTTPNSPSVMMQLSRIYQKLDKQALFLEALQQVIRLDPQGLGLMAINELGVQEGETLLKADKLDQAEKAFSRVLKLAPENNYAVLGMAKVSVKRGENSKAIELTQKVILRDPSNSLARVLLAEVYVKTGQLQAAVLELERVNFVEGNTPLGRLAVANLTNIYRSRAEALSKEGNLASAVREYQNAIKRDPADHKAHMELGRIYHRDPAYRSQAITQYRKVIELQPDSLAAYLNLGTLLELNEDYEGAMNAYLTALSRVKENKADMQTKLTNAVRMQLVRLEFTSKNYQWALDELTEMLELEPDNSRIHFMLSVVNSAREEYDHAVKNLQQNLFYDENNHNTRLRLAALYERINEDELALTEYRHLQRVSKNSRIQELVTNRIPYLENRTRKLVASIQYNQMENITQYLGENVRNRAYNSTLLFDAGMRIKPHKSTLLMFNVTPTFSTYHELRNDSLRPRYNATLITREKDASLIIAGSRQRSQGLMLEETRGIENSLSASVSQKIKFPESFSTNEYQIPKTLVFSTTYRQLESHDFSLFLTESVDASASLIYPRHNGGSWTATYNFIQVLPYKNGSTDYQGWHYRASFQYSDPLLPRVTGILTTSAELKRYKNPDSNALFTLGKRQKRRTLQTTIGVRLGYEVHRRLSLFADSNFSLSVTNLPRGFIYDEQGEATGFQSPLFDDFWSFSASAGMRFKF